MIGYIEQIIPTKTFINRETNKEFRVAKFLINNNDGARAQVNMFNENIERFLDQVQLNQVQVKKVDIWLNFLHSRFLERKFLLC